MLVVAITYFASYLPLLCMTHMEFTTYQAHSAGPASRPSHTAPAAVASGPPPPPKAFPLTVKREYAISDG